MTLEYVPLTLKPPYTIYSVALLYSHPKKDRWEVSIHLINVSGDNPLTEQEVVNRAKQKHQSDWKQSEPLEEWRYQTFAIAHTVINSLQTNVNVNFVPQLPIPVKRSTDCPYHDDYNMWCGHCNPEDEDEE